MRTYGSVCGLLVLAVAGLTHSCSGEFTNPLSQTPPAKNDPEAHLASLASLSTSGIVHGVASWEHKAPNDAAAVPVPRAAGSYHGAAASPSSHAKQQQTAEKPLEPPHKALLPLGTSDLATLLLTVITLFIAAGGGIGGGAVFIVCFVFVGGFAPAQAVALSNITILGGSLANFIANSSRRHPVLNRPLIDWDLILVMEPTTMLGALLGGYMNKVRPGSAFANWTKQQQQQQQQFCWVRLAGRS
eukprot:GHRQ01007759.1.p1 GENE.GHRQ01007759.1~~GHRQ01007759.1.p1  ORF type:complete len:244 (+),score=87.80 GHRQ01007759.1:259-990(+)